VSPPPPALPPHDDRQAREWMRDALEAAREASAMDEPPVGCVIIDHRGRRVARTHDRRRADADPLAHAEMLAIRQAARDQGDWRMDGMTLVVTLEPCPMCAGSILMARVGRVIIGAPSPKWGAAGSRADWLGSGCFPHKPEVVRGVLERECGEILSRYFEQVRKKG